MTSISDWITQQLSLLYNAVEHSDYYKTYGELKWPPSKNAGLIEKEDIVGTTKFITNIFPLATEKCYMRKIKDRLRQEPRTIDDFFLHMHILAHHLIRRFMPQLNIEVPSDLSFIENTSLLFAAMACHKYFNLDILTIEMSKSIIGGIHDSVMIEKSYGRKYDGDDHLDTCEEMFKLLDKQLKSLLS